jgi:hypothetical protein
MLNITDLMFGDYIQNLSGAIFRMTAAIFTRYLNDNSFGMIFKPVELTDEILESNFPDTDILSWWPIGKDGYYHIEIEQDDSEDSLGGPEVIIKLKYVHELQHLLKICNIDKDIKLR